MEDEPVRIPITDVFDLHTVPPRDLKEVVTAYLEEAYALGLRALRIIHGKGIGVQREVVRSVLARTAFVQDYADAPMEAGGWGATVVTLRPPARIVTAPDESSRNPLPDPGSTDKRTES